MSQEQLLERQSYIDSLLYWRQPFSSKDIEQRFSVTRQTVKRDLDHYRACYPNNAPVIDLIDRKKHYRQPESYQAVLAETDFSRFIQQQFRHSSYSIPAPKIGRTPPPALMGPLLYAIKHQLRFESRYYSVSSGDTEQRVIQPHSIAQACGRFHVRAWCEKSQRFSDFVLARFDDYAELLGAAPIEHGIEQDRAWNTELHLSIVPDTRLTDNRRKAVEMEYAMKGGKLQLQTRAALVNYLLKDLRVDRYQENPNAQQIILDPQSREQIAPYLWG